MRTLGYALGATTPVIQNVQSVTVHPPKKVGTNREGVDLLAIRKEFCLAIGDSLKTFKPIGGPGYGALVQLASTTYKEGQCNDRTMSQALWVGFADAFWGYAADKAKGKGADVVWDPALNALLKKARLKSTVLGSAAKNLFNNWILQNVLRITGNSVECYRIHKFPALECAYATATNALMAQRVT